MILKKTCRIFKTLSALFLGCIIISCFLPCHENADCPIGLYCAKYTGDCNGDGRCSPKPTVCTDDWIPVCGCDGNVYSNHCYAAREGVNVDYVGKCRDESCDDGTDLLCDMIPPVCAESELLAIQNNCWACVNPAACRPWGEPGCEKNEDCPAGSWCDPCGTSSCPACDNCVPACSIK